MAVEVKNQIRKSPRILLGVLFLAVFFLGFFLGKQDTNFSNFGFTPKLTGRGTNNSNADFGSFWKAWELLEENYDGQLDYQKMVEGAIRGLTDSLGDPYTSYLSKDEANQLNDDLSGTISGIGAEIGIKNNKMVIISPLKDSPAEKAGLKTGDNLAFINDESTDSMSVTDAVARIRGEAGTKVNLKIIRNGELKTFEITREKFTVDSVDSEILENNIGYVGISRFDDTTTAELSAALDKLVARGVKKVVLDLRDNPGGYLDVSVEVASQFVKSGVVVREGKIIDSAKKYTYKASGDGKMTGDDVKIVVLINQGSASASEIVAGALQDYKRATIVGEKSYGKGSVQQLENLMFGSKMRITVAHWYTPNGNSISNEGIKPDVEVILTDDDYNNDRDPQLAKAIELLSK